MAKLSKEQIAVLETQLDRQFSSVYFRCDGYLVFASMVRHKNKLVIQIFVNGVLKGSDIFFGKADELDKMTDICKRFYSLHKKLQSKRTFDLNVKLYGKKAAEKMRVDDTYYFSTPYFSTAKAFMRHLVANNKDITVLDYHEYKYGIDELRETSSEHSQSI